MKVTVSIIVIIFLFAPFSAAGQTDATDDGTSVVQPSGEGNGVIALPENVYATSSVPLILPRSTWENTDELKNILSWTPQDAEKEGKPNDYQPVKRFFIHYTVTSQKTLDTYSPVKIIQSIYRYHAVTRGWGDIGYNYLIDQQGNIYEGRYGGNGVTGAHVYSSTACINFNYGSIGIGLLGDYHAQDMPEAMYESIARLIGWLSAANELNPIELSLASPVWQNIKIGEKQCNTEQGNFSSFAGPVVLGHKDVPGGSPDPGVVDLGRVRREAAINKDIYAHVLYDTDSDPVVYFIHNGKLSEYASARSEVAGNTVNATSTESGVIRILQTQRDLFSVAESPAFADGSLIKSFTREEVYRIEKGERRHIVSEEVFKNNKFAWNAIKAISDRQIAAYPLGFSITYPDRTLLSGSVPAVYMIEKGEKRIIPSPLIFREHGFIWSNIKKVKDSVIIAHRDGKPLLLPSGALVRGEKGNQIYVIEGDAKRPIPSATVFKAYEYLWSNIKVISETEMNRYALGAPVGYPDGMIVREAGSPKVYLFEKGTPHWIQTASAFSALGLAWTKIVLAGEQEFAAYPVGSPIASSEDLALIRSGSQPSPAPRPSPPPEEAFKRTEPKIRVGLFTVPVGSLVKVTANGDYDVYSEKGFFAEKKANAVAQAPAEIEGLTRFVSKATSTVFEIASHEDRPSWNQEINYNAFRGTLEVAYSSISKEVWVINELPLEDYLTGIAEALNTDREEYLKAFSIITRSYALYHIENGGKRKGELFHLNNTPSDQIYKGYSHEIIAPNIALNVKATRGIVATYQGKLIRAVYSSDSGGITKSACAQWGSEFCEPWYGYLAGGVQDPEGTAHDPKRVEASHGVGMSAIGARKMAERGKIYSDILNAYYQGITIEKVYK